MKMKLGFIGAGKVGTALAVKLTSKGYPVIGVYDVKPESAKQFADAVKGCKVMASAQAVADAAELVVISTSDAFIKPVASSVKWRKGQIVLHCSGANTVALLETARQAGALVGVLHPDLTFADTRQAVQNIPGASFDIEGEGPVLDVLKELATALDGHWIVLKAEDKPVFHVASEFTTLFVMELFRLAARMMNKMEISDDQTVLMSLPMIRGIANIIENFGTSRPLTGPVDRGDNDTIKRHIDGLKRLAPEVLPLYRELVRQNIPFAVQHHSIDKKKAEELLALINTYGV